MAISHFEDLRPKILHAHLYYMYNIQKGLRLHLNKK